MGTSQMSRGELDKIRKADACFASGGLMWVAALGAFFVLVSWAAGGQAFMNSFYGARALAALAVLCGVGAAWYAVARKRASA